MTLAPHHHTAISLMISALRRKHSWHWPAPTHWCAAGDRVSAPIESHAVCPLVPTGWQGRLGWPHTPSAPRTALSSHAINRVWR